MAGIFSFLRDLRGGVGPWPARLGRGLRAAVARLATGVIGRGGASEPGGRTGSFDWIAEVELARREWLAARDLFDEVTDVDAVDQAVFSMDAAERRYVYLLKQARQDQARALILPR